MGLPEYVLCICLPLVNVVLFVFGILHWRRPRMKHGEILPAGVMKDKYGLTSDKYRPPRMNPARVPEHLRDLLPLARKWGIGDDIIRDDLREKASAEEKNELEQAVSGRERSVFDWLDSLDPASMSREAAAFMFMMSALEEIRVLGMHKNGA
jgi:hypothetical protein